MPLRNAGDLVIVALWTSLKRTYPNWGLQEILQRCERYVTCDFCSEITLSQLLNNKPTPVQQKFWSIHPEHNPLFSIPGLDVFKNPSCLMHAADHGVFVRLLASVFEFVSSFGTQVVQELEER